MAIPKEKKRRDKSGINQLKKTGQKKMDATGTKLQKPAEVDESTSAGSAAGGSSTYVGYAGPAAFSSKGDLSGDFKGKNKKKSTDPKAKPISTGFSLKETNYLTDPSGFEIYVEMLNEEAKSKSQQQLMGMAYAVKTGKFNGEPSAEVQKLADTMSEKDLDDFASTKHKGLPDHVKENTENMDNMQHNNYNPDVFEDRVRLMADLENGVISTEEKKEFLRQQASPGLERMYDNADDNVLNSMYFKYWATMNKMEEDMQSIANGTDMSMKNNAQATGEMSSNVPMGAQQTSGLNEEEFIPHGSYTVSNAGGYEVMLNDAGDAARVRDAYGSDNPETSDWLEIEYVPNEEGESEPVIDPNGYNIPLNQVMRMTESSQLTEINEDMTLLEEINKELAAFETHHKKLKLMAEDKKTPSMVQGDRLRAENPKNFKKDIQHSGVKQVIDVEKELQWKDQQTDVGDDPQKLGQDIEKQAIKVADMKGDEALKNVGNSANNDGDEIPKRNLTTAEQDEVDLYRNGQHSLNYDNEPGDRFVDRMKADQGEFFEKGEKQKEFKAGAPMYDKDPQPVEQTEVDKVEFDKNVKQKGNKVAWNERMGIGSNIKLGESMITGRYKDALGKNRLMEFRLGEVEEVEAIAEHEAKMSFDGLGNTYMNKTVDKKVIVNEGVVDIMENYQFYTNGEKVFSIKNPVQNLNEGEVKEKPVISEQEKKMKHLLGYKPQDFVNTKNIKL